VPIFAGRRIIASPRGSNSDEALVQEIASLFDETYADELWRRASSFNISFLYLHRTMGPTKYERLTEVLRTSPDRFSVVFDNGGLTLVWVLAESHLVLHHWEMEGFATLDLHLCNYRGSNIERARRLVEAGGDHPVRATRRSRPVRRVHQWRGG